MNILINQQWRVGCYAVAVVELLWVYCGGCSFSLISCIAWSVDLVLFFTIISRCNVRFVKKKRWNPRYILSRSQDWLRKNRVADGADKGLWAYRSWIEHDRCCVIGAKIVSVLPFDLRADIIWRASTWFVTIGIWQWQSFVYMCNFLHAKTKTRP